MYLIQFRKIYVFPSPYPNRLAVQFLSKTLFRPGFLAVPLLFVLASTVTPVGAAASSPEGTWHGSGSIQVDKGKPERVKCRVNYKADVGSRYTASFTCVSRSAGKKHHTISLKRIDDQRLAGNFYDAKRKLSVTISVYQNGRHQTVSLSSDKGKGTIHLER